MSDVSINYNGMEIASLDDSGTKTLLTSGKYCEDNIDVVYTKPSGGGGTNGLKDCIITHSFWTGSVSDGKLNNLTSSGTYKQLFLPFVSPVQINNGDSISLTITKQSGTAPFCGYGFVEENQLSDIIANTTATGTKTITADHDFLANGIWMYGRTGNLANFYATISLSINGATVF